MGKLTFDLHAAAVLAPGMDSLAALRAACRSGQPPHSAGPLAGPVVFASPAMLPPNERRRSSQVVRLALSCIEQALQTSPFPPETLRSVFATDEGTGAICQQMLESLATTRQLSPLLFTNSVHNAPSGYFTIALRNQQSATVVSLGLESFASGLLCAVTEATATGQPVLLACYDPVMPAPLDEMLEVTEPTATAWILSGHGLHAGAALLGAFELELGPAAEFQPTALPGWIPARWHANSSARAIAALALLEDGPDAIYRVALGSQLLGLRRLAPEVP